MKPGEYPQGLWSFSNFPAYLNEWIRPILLKDLETVFEGAADHWRRFQLRGRGDFVLATALFAIFDHLGAFLAEDESDSLDTYENIARLARVLPSTAAVDAIIAHCGRNPLVHGAWPQTTLLMKGGSWAFGLNISADPRPISELGEPTHDFLYRRQYPGPGSMGDGSLLNILKFRLNVRVLRLELQEGVERQHVFGDVKPGVFDRIQRNAIVSCELRRSKRFNELRSGRKPTALPFADVMQRQIMLLRGRAIREGNWDPEFEKGAG